MGALQHALCAFFIDVIVVQWAYLVICGILSMFTQVCDPHIRSLPLALARALVHVCTRECDGLVHVTRSLIDST